MSFKYCNHVKENGTYCRAAALSGRNYCYFHARVRARRLALAQARAQNNAWEPQLPPLEDMHAVQSSIMQVLEALAAGLLDPRRARLMLQGLQMASINLRTNSWRVDSRFQLNRDADFRAQSYGALESEFGLPKRIGLDTPPEVAFPSPEKEAARISTARGKEKPAAAEGPAAATAAKAKNANRTRASEAARRQATDWAEPTRAGAAKRPPLGIKLAEVLTSRAAEVARE